MKKNFHMKKYLIYYLMYMMYFDWKKCWEHQFPQNHYIDLKMSFSQKNGLNLYWSYCTERISFHLPKINVFRCLFLKNSLYYYFIIYMKICLLLNQKLNSIEKNNFPFWINYVTHPKNMYFHYKIDHRWFSSKSKY